MKLPQSQKDINRINYTITAVLLAIVLFILFALSSCKEAFQKPKTPDQKPKTPEVIIIKKVVVDKHESTETDFRYKYNFWKGNFYHQPDIHNYKQNNL